ncbi:hypothetical protein HJC23_006050 [Cyclotella cryptica]|uniref:PX domain-containing protein n=1 Tax=Cyclotella cryptica TaxID=29204 RepID=A0ABD3PUD4_9STRA|eukprot:CCRYP_011338-RA/>CCRYP_011338-RA protein AED:0.00 eAED:0.00 QI:70/-1/1/1/-1/1/1/214/555
MPHPKSNDSSIVTVDLSGHPPQTPLGMLLAPSALPNEPCRHDLHGNGHARKARQTNVTLVAGWEHLPQECGLKSSHQLGPIQRSGLVRLGDRLVRINGKDVTDWSFREVMDTLRQFIIAPNATPNNNTDGTNKSLGKKRLKSLGFAPRYSREWTRNTEFDVASPILFGLLDGNKQVHEKRLYSFASFVARWRVMRDEYENGEARVPSSLNDAAILMEENSLEQHLNKEPLSFDNNGVSSLISQPDDRTHAKTSTAQPKPYIQYEIQCHLLFHSKTFTRKQNHNGNSYSWSIWKRYSQFRTLDAELRSLHGWQMDALNEGRGIFFPSERYLETWWYDVSGVVNKYFTGEHALESAEVKMEHGAKSDPLESTESVVNCPYPEHFIAKRQKELAAYWSQLMRIEEMFEFDTSSHKFAKVVASFLEVDRILAKRISSTHSIAGSASARLSRPPVIHEEIMTDGLSSELILPSSTIPMGIREDDDVSLLSDGTGLRESLDYRASPLRNVVMHQHHYGTGTSTSSVVSASSINSNQRRFGKTPRGARQGAKPAFQREFLAP